MKEKKYFTLIQMSISIFLLTIMFFAVGLGKCFAGHGTGLYAPDRILVKFKGNITAEQASDKGYTINATFMRKFDKSGICVYKLDANEEIAIKLQELKSDPDIEFAEPDYLVSACIVPDDTYYPDQWGMPKVAAPETWDYTTNGSGVIIACIDSGINYNHPDLAGNLWVNSNEIPNNGIDDDLNGYVDDYWGWDFENGDKDPIDDYGHGTMVAGVMAAVGNNTIGVAGVCWSARIMTIKFLDSNGDGYLSDAVPAIEYAVQMGAKIINNSWGGPDYSASLSLAIQLARDKGVRVVAAAGNDSLNMDPTPNREYPACYGIDNIISVMATDQNDFMPYWTNYGYTTADLAAPGQSIKSTAMDGDYMTKDGTSFSAPFVSGTAALIWTTTPSLTYAQVKNYIMNTVDIPPSLNTKCVTGGRLNIRNALLASSDFVPPAAVTNLSVKSFDYNFIKLEWTAPGDDANSGKAHHYDFRYSRSEITAGNWDNATQASGAPTPETAGTVQTFKISGLSDGIKYYFAMKTYDEGGLVSDLSNVINQTTIDLENISAAANGGQVYAFSSQRNATVGAASNVIDDITTKTSSGGAWSSVTNPTYGQFVKIKLSKLATIRQIKFIMKGIKTNKWPKKVKIKASQLQNSGFIKIASVTLNNTDNVQKIDLPNSATQYRYVKVTIKSNYGGNAVQISEIMIKGN
ncbi:MAG: S8 family serine peptidase [Candidatus Theseobacter exili]|nr:S8 family serine peptidase [Candidatus Theseobacter exili]